MSRADRRGPGVRARAGQQVPARALGHGSKAVRLGSLFAGIGGFDLGFKRAGILPAWQVEIDKAASSVLAHHWPSVRRYSDVRDCGANLEPVDVIVGGFPCQDMSVAGRRAGFDGDRSVLYYEMTRIVDGLKPAFFVWENVPGLFSSRGGRDFGAVLAEMDRIGYVGGWRVLDAQHFGVAQRRRRIFGCFARRDIGAKCVAEILALAESVRGDFKARRNTAKEVAPTLDRRAGSSGQHTFAISGGLVAMPFAFDTAQITSTLNQTRVGPNLPVSTLASGSRLHVAYAFHASQDPISGNVCPAISGNATIGVHNHRGVRRLTPTECERLQGFPDGWTLTGHDNKPMSDATRYRMLGNAVAVPCAEWLGKRMVKYAPR